MVMERKPPVVVDIETTGELPWTGELVALGIGTTVYKPDEGRKVMKELMADDTATVICHTNYDLRWLLLDSGQEMAKGFQFWDTKVMAFMLDAFQLLGLDPLAQRYLGLDKLHKPIKFIERTKTVLYDMSQGFGLGESITCCSVCNETKIGDEVYTPGKQNKPCTRPIPTPHKWVASAGVIPIEDVPWPEMVAYNGQDLTVTADLCIALKSELEKSGQWQMYLEEEMPFSKLLVEMEVAGMPMDTPELVKMHAGASAERDDLGEKLGQDSGVIGFNLKSGDQVASFLYDELPEFKVEIEVPLLKDLAPSVSKGKCKKCGSAVVPVDPEDPRPTKFVHLDSTLEPCLGRANMREEVIRAMIPDEVRIASIGNKYVRGTQVVDGRGLTAPKMRKKKGKMPARPPIDAETLTLLYQRDPWVSTYLRWKSLNTLCTNYFDQWLAVVHNGRIHGRFDQARTETGRVASRDPNLQAIPVSMEWNVRTLFKEDLIIGDYSGLDARVAASMCEDPLMLDIFRNGRDLYGTLAANAWGGPADKSNENRSLMKILFLSAQYSAGAGSIGDKIRISGQPDKADKAKELLRDMEETLPVLFQWKREMEDEARSLGYVETMGGRRRYLPDLYSKEWGLKARAERQVVASKVQGTSADLVRRCMLAAREAFPHSVCRMILQVHDEVLWKCGPEWKDEYLPELQNIMETAHRFELNVPMAFPCDIGDSWDEKDAQGARSYRAMAMAGSV